MAKKPEGTNFDKLLEELNGKKNETGGENQSASVQKKSGFVTLIGRPNVGKSTFINKVARRKAAAAGDRPGVTRGKQWITVDQGLELLDTPGILWPRFDSQEVGELLAITGAIKAEVLDRETLAANFMLRLAKFYPDAVEQRYKFRPDPACNGFELLEQAAKKRGFLISGGEYDLERMAGVLLDEYRGGKLGRITLEMPEAEA